LNFPARLLSERDRPSESLLLFGIHPATAVGTDLIYAAATKAGGAVVHGLNRTVEWCLASGSAPASP